MVRPFTNLQKDLIIGTLLGNSKLQLIDFYKEHKVIMTITQDIDRLEYLNLLYRVMCPFVSFKGVQNFNDMDEIWSLEIALNYEKYPNGFYTLPLKQLVIYFNNYSLKNFILIIFRNT